VKFTFRKRHPIRAKATGHPRIVTVSRPHPRRNVGPVWTPPTTTARDLVAHHGVALYGYRATESEGHGSIDHDHRHCAQGTAHRGQTLQPALSLRLGHRNRAGGARRFVFRDRHVGATSRSTLATIAAIVGAVGAFCGVVANMFGGINLAVVSTARLTNLQAARFLTTSFNSSTGKTFLDVYVFSEFLAPVLMFVALWRSRLVPRWLTILFVVGFELAEQTPSAGTVRVVAMMALFVVSMTLLAVWIWRSAGSRDAQAIDASN